MASAIWVLAIIGLFIILVVVASAAERLTLLAPKSSKRIAGAAQCYCLHQCRLPDGRCPLLRADMRREDCPLWRFVDSDLSTDLPVDPSAPLGTGPHRNPDTADRAATHSS